LLRLDESEGELEYETAERTDSEQVCRFQLILRVSVAECVVASSCAVFSSSVVCISIRACLCFRGMPDGES